MYVASMASFQDTRNSLLFAYDEDIIDDEEFAPLYDLHTSKNPCFPYDEYDHFNLEAVDSVECKAEFRVEKNDIPLLAEVLRVPATFRSQQGAVCDVEGLCILLKRLAYPCRFSDMIPRFSKPVPVLSMITNTVVDYIYEEHMHRITGWNQTILNPDKLEQYAEAISMKGAALENCFGFIDGTVRAICHPEKNQRIVYNGHKRVHAIKFQSVTLPSGMIAQMFGTIGGKIHDARMLRESGLLDLLEENAYSQAGRPMCLYRDPAYPPRIHLQPPYRNAQITPQMKNFNKSMSYVGVTVEWLFADIVNYAYHKLGNPNNKLHKDNIF